MVKHRSDIIEDLTQDSVVNIVTPKIEVVMEDVSLGDDDKVEVV